MLKKTDRELEKELKNEKKNVNNLGKCLKNF